MNKIPGLNSNVFFDPIGLPFSQVSSGGITPVWGLGRGIKFDGVNDYVVVNNLSGVAVDSSYMAASVWVKVNTLFTTIQDYAVYTSSTGNSNKLTGILITFATNGNMSINFRIANDAGVDLRQTDYTILSGDYVAGDPLHLAFCFDSSGVENNRLWVNGILRINVSQGATTFLTTFGTTSVVGCDRLAAGRYSPITVGDIIVFGGHNLTQANVDALYNSGAGADPSDTIATTNMYFWHKYDEDPTTTACIDSSSNGTRTGTLTNFAGGGDASERPTF